MFVKVNSCSDKDIDGMFRISQIFNTSVIDYTTATVLIESIQTENCNNNLNGAFRAAVDSPARLCRRGIKGRQQGVLPPPVYHKCSPSTMHSPLWRKGGISVTIQPGLRTCCADREKMIQESKNPIAGGDFKWILPVTVQLAELLRISITCTEEYKEHIEYMFHAFL